jgi:hypothetical protein
MREGSEVAYDRIGGSMVDNMLRKVRKKEKAASSQRGYTGLHERQPREKESQLSKGTCTCCRYILLYHCASVIMTPLPNPHFCKYELGWLSCKPTNALGAVPLHHASMQ